MADYKVRQVAPLLDDDEIDGVRAAVASAWLSEGPYAAEFLEAVKRDTGAPHAVLAPNGTLGLFLSLLALDLPRGSEILIPSFTFCASASAAVFAGLTPVFADVDPDTWNLDVASLEGLVTDRTRAVMPVHVFGHAAPMDGVLDFARRHGLAVVEDAAQGYGVSYLGRHVGTWGDLGVISFFSDKTVTTGEGAVVLTRRDDLHGRLRLLRNQGRESAGTFVHPALGMNFRMTDLQCAVGAAQLRKLPAIVGAKQANYARYLHHLEGVPGVRLLRVQPGSDLVPFRFPLVVRDREAVVAGLERAGVQTRPFFHPLHRQPCLAEYARGPLPVSEELAERGVCLPVHGGLTGAEVDAVCAVVKAVLGSGR